MERLIHDCAWGATPHFLELFKVPEEQRAQAFAEVHVRLKATLEVFCIQQDRMRDRLRPGTGRN